VVVATGGSVSSAFDLSSADMIHIPVSRRRRQQ
jgi:hypothetical protein